MRSIGRALGLLAGWLRVPSFLRDLPFPVGSTASARPIGRGVAASCSLVASPSKLAPGSHVQLLGLGLLLLGSAALPALAYASPPDPSWIPGIYDDADYDDVVRLATCATGDIAPALPGAAEPHPPLVASILRLVQTGPHGPAPSALHSRAPPTS